MNCQVYSPQGVDMNHCHLASGFCWIVLIFGLVSCAKDKTSRDHFHAPPPVIHSQEVVDLKAWDNLKHKSLDLRDYFDVSETALSRLDVTSRCRHGQVYDTGFFQPNPSRPISVFQVLPRNLLLLNLTQESLDCSFEFVLFNQIGSRHVYHLSSSAIVDKAESPIILEDHRSEGAPLVINDRQWANLKIRYLNERPVSAQILCEDIDLNALPFEKVVEISFFDIRRPQFHEGQKPSSLIERPFQTCRIAMLENGSLKDLSSLFKIQFTKPPLEAEISKILTPNRDQKLGLQFAKGLHLAQVKIVNPDKFGVRYLSVPKQGSESRLDMYWPYILNNGQTVIATVDIQDSWFHLEPSAAEIVEDRADHWKIRIPAGQTVEFGLRLVPSRPRNCHPRWFQILPIDVAITGQVRLKEISAEGHIVEDVILKFPRTAFSENGYDRQFVSQPKGLMACQW